MINYESIGKRYGLDYNSFNDIPLGSLYETDKELRYRTQLLILKEMRLLRRILKSRKTKINEKELSEVKSLLWVVGGVEYKGIQLRVS